MANTDLSIVRKRDELPPQKNSAPYWHRLRPGAFVGFRPAADGAAGTWLARVELPTGRKQETLESYGQFAASERFAKAKAAAEAFAARMENGGEALAITVADQCRVYLKSHPDAEHFFDYSVFSDPLGAIELADLKRQNLVDWRTRLEARPSKRNGGKPLAKSSVNREIVPLRAALYMKLAPGAKGTEAAWQEALKKHPHAVAHRRRMLVLDRDQRRALLASCSKEVYPFVRALCLLPIRPGALAQLTAGEFNRRQRNLHIPAGLDKKHAERWVPLEPQALALIAEMAKDKHPNTLLFMRDDRTAWNRDNWWDPIHDAAKAAKLPKGVCAYTLRHSVITDMVEANHATLTIAKVAGTSVKEIEETYGHVRVNAERAALACLAI